MSFSEEWVLPEPVGAYASEALVAQVAAIVAGSAEVAIRDAGDARALTISFGAAQVEALASKLAERPGQLDWDWRADLDPPRRGGSRYVVQIDVVHDDPPLLRIDSNVEENRAAWPILFSIASSLAEELGVAPDEEAPPSSDELPIFIEPGRRGGESKPN